MQTQCPKCKTIFSVAPSQLNAADGLVRCGQCNSVFDGKEFVSFVKPENLHEQLKPLPESISKEPVSEGVSKQKNTEGESSSFNFEANKGLSEASDTDINIEELEMLSNTRLATNRSHALWDIIAEQIRFRPLSRRMNLALIGGSLVLLYLLVMQIIYFHRHELVRHTAYAPFVHSVCKLIGCEVNPQYDTSLIEVVNRNVFSHPNEDSALMITATLVNNAPFAQPYPLLQLSLTNLQGTTIAARRFIPSEYLAETNNIDALMQQGDPINVKLEVLDPGNNAIAFEFSFF